ncbi:MAG: primase C-terminal domain-containing protein, partial [Treponema sp.]|nr:primase C-terminal domain-containing protein [Treponema sp.]
AGQYNEKRFEYPLPVSEVKATARSVTKWVIKRMDDEGFQAWGDRRRQRSADVRHAKAEERAEQIQAYKQGHPELSNRAIAREMGCSEFTVRKALRFL